MKQLLKPASAVVLCTAAIFTLASFTSPKKIENKPVVTAYSINLVSKTMIGSNEQWTWSLSNTNPGNGSDGTLQDVSHWSLAMNNVAEAALVSAEISNDGVNWHTVPISIDRDPAIRACTTTDVLKFEEGTSGTTPTYYRATFSARFDTNPYSCSYIKTGGGLCGCNLYYYAGPATSVILD